MVRIKYVFLSYKTKTEFVKSYFSANHNCVKDSLEGCVLDWPFLYITPPYFRSPKSSIFISDDSNPRFREPFTVANSNCSFCKTNLIM